MRISDYPLDRDYLLVQLSEWAYLADRQDATAIDREMVQYLIRSQFGDDWFVETHITPPTNLALVGRLAYMWVINRVSFEVILVFRGRAAASMPSFRNIVGIRSWALEHLRAQPTIYSFPSILPVQVSDRASVHEGLKLAWQTAQNDIWLQFRAIAHGMRAKPTLLITGHSLGGALAQFFFVDALVTSRGGPILNPDSLAEIYFASFSAPQIGNAEFENSVGQLVGSTGVPASGQAYEARAELVGLSDTDESSGFLSMFTAFAGVFAPSHFAVSVDIFPDNDSALGLPLSHSILHFVEYFRDRLLGRVECPKDLRVNSVVLVIYNMVANHGIKFNLRQLYDDLPNHVRRSETILSGNLDPNWDTHFLKSTSPTTLYNQYDLILELGPMSPYPSWHALVDGFAVYLDGRPAAISPELRLDLRSNSWNFSLSDWHRAAK
ncbi:MAG: hypothetical protein JNN02_06375 [Tabrizicola sp.]|nr:hypothetical protein [Tabrizicola sp.]